MDNLSVRQILFPTDYSEISRIAGRTAAQLARHFDARLHVIHVVPSVTDPGPREALSTAIADLASQVDVITAIVNGRPAREIVDYATQHDIDLVVMGTHGRTGVSRALLGSVAEAVVRRAPCPVLTVPAASAPLMDDRPLPAEDPRVVCGELSAELICDTCRSLIRNEGRTTSVNRQHGGQAAKR
jgi:universal stress protein A